MAKEYNNELYIAVDMLFKGEFNEKMKKKFMITKENQESSPKGISLDNKSVSSNDSLK